MAQLSPYDFLRAEYRAGKEWADLTKIRERSSRFCARCRCAIPSRSPHSSSRYVAGEGWVCGRCWKTAMNAVVRDLHPRRHRLNPPSLA
jgi:hypothetical protein